MENFNTFDMETHEQKAYLRACFSLADRRKRGYLDLRDLKCAVAAALGTRASKLVLSQIFSHQLQGDESIDSVRITQEDFVATILPRVVKVDLLEHVRRSFKAFDARSQGFISFASFQHACKMAMPHMGEKTMFEIFREADRDGDGRVTYNDFEAMHLLAQQINATHSAALKQNYSQPLSERKKLGHRAQSRPR